MRVLTVKNTFAVSVVATGILIRFILHRYFGVLGFEATTAFSLNNGSLSNSLYGIIVPLLIMVFIGVCISNKTAYHLFSFAGVKTVFETINPAVFTKRTGLIYLRQ